MMRALTSTPRRLSRWFGLNAAEISGGLPNLGNFASAGLGFIALPKPASPGDRCQLRIPADQCVQMGVQVDKAGRYHRAPGVDLASALSRDLARGLGHVRRPSTRGSRYPRTGITVAA